MMCGVRPSAKIILCARLLMMTVVALPDARPQQPGHSLPKFEDYPVKEVFRRTPHPPVLGTPEQQLYRTRIREGVEEGSGVWINGEWGKEQGKPGPNFAGHYVVIVWGCGAGCIRMAISNAETGAVCDPPVSAGGLALPMLMFPASVGRAPELEYRVNSRLMIIKATPHWERNDAVSYAFYFLWRGEHWTLLRRVPIEE
jgi:hypothetical protein